MIVRPLSIIAPAGKSNLISLFPPTKRLNRVGNCVQRRHLDVMRMEKSLLLPAESAFKEAYPTPGMVWLILRRHSPKIKSGALMHFCVTHSFPQKKRHSRNLRRERGAVVINCLPVMVQDDRYGE